MGVRDHDAARFSLSAQSSRGSPVSDHASFSTIGAVGGGPRVCVGGEEIRNWGLSPKLLVLAHFVGEIGHDGGGDRAAATARCPPAAAAAPKDDANIYGLYQLPVTW
jgi:hypothetical protein